MDLFSLDTSTKLPSFVSWKPCPGSSHVDAFTLNWKNIKGYIFPPFALISRIVKKVFDDEALELYCLLPDWQTRPWWPAVERLMKGGIWRLPPSMVKKIHLPWDIQKRHPMGEKLKMNFLCLSIKSYKFPLYRPPRLSLFQNMHGAMLLKHRHGYSVRKWYAFTEEKKTSPTDFTFKNIMGFLEYLRSKGVSVNNLKTAKTLMITARECSGRPMAPNENFPSP